MKKYSKYKQSGIEWLGEIPERWELKRLKDYMGVNMGQSPDSESYNDEGLGLPFYQGNADFGELYPMKRLYCDEPKKIATKNDILISVRAPVGEMNISDSECCIGRGLTALTVKTGDYKYAYYLLSVIKEELKMFVTGSTFEAVSANDISVIKYLNPTQTEQTVIANYLDERTAKLDKLIKNKENQIEKLKEIRQIEINTAVTKGLNHNAKMKDFGIDWLGEIPEHWEVKRIKNIASLRDKKGLEYKDDEFLVALENIESWTGRYIDTQSEFDIGGIRFKTGDVLFGKLRPYLAKVYLSEEEGVCVSEILAINTDQRVLSKFLFYRLLSSDFISIVNSSTYGAKMPRANWQFISNLKIPYPKNKEQEKIIKYLDDRISSITKLLDNLDSQLERLKEIRKIEIYNAVTGKIKVI